MYPSRPGLLRQGKVDVNCFVDGKPVFLIARLEAPYFKYSVPLIIISLLARLQFEQASVDQPGKVNLMPS